MPLPTIGKSIHGYFYQVKITFGFYFLHIKISMDTFATPDLMTKYPWIFCLLVSGFFFLIFDIFLSSETTCPGSASTHWWNTPLSGECVWASKVHGGPSLRVYWRKSKLIFPEIPVRLAGSSWTKTAHSNQVILFPTHLAM